MPGWIVDVGFGISVGLVVGGAMFIIHGIILWVRQRRRDKVAK